MCRKADIMSQKMLHLPPFRKKREKSETEASEISHLNKQSKDTFTIDLSCLKEKSTPTFFGDTKIFREKLSPKSQIGKIDSGMSDKRQIKGCIVRRFKPFKLQQMNK